MQPDNWKKCSSCATRRPPFALTDGYATAGHLENNPDSPTTEQDTATGIPVWQLHAKNCEGSQTHLRQANRET